MPMNKSVYSAATVAGAAFAFAPFRLEQDGHLQVISSGGIPLALALAVRGIRLRRPGWLFGGWLVAAWQISLGFALGLPFAYVLAGILLMMAIAVPIYRRRMSREERRNQTRPATPTVMLPVAAARPSGRKPTPVRGWRLVGRATRGSLFLSHWLAVIPLALAKVAFGPPSREFARTSRQAHRDR